MMRGLPVLAATITSGGFNVISDGSCNPNGTTDQSFTDALLGSLADNGGPTMTHALMLPGSDAVDAGTEGNDEIINGGGAPGTPGIPADPGGNSGTGASGVTGADHNLTVHVHRGIVGDTDPIGGTSDLNSAVHQWNNPVAKVVITVGNEH